MAGKKNLFLILLLITYSLHAQHALYLPDKNRESESGWLQFAASAETGLLAGMLYEYVFIADDPDGIFNDMLSRLDWQLNPLFYAGVTLQVELWNQLTVDLGFWAGIPALLGSMEDRDWVDPGTGNYTGILGIISFHDNFLTNAFFIDVNVGYKAVDSPCFILTPLIGFNWKHILMSGRNGHQEKPPGTPVGTFDGEVITYEQNYFIYYFGVQATWAPHPLFQLQLFCCYSPLVFGVNIDKHLLRSLEFVDLPVFGHYFCANPAVCLNITEDLSLRLEGSFNYIPAFQGKIYARPLSGGDYSLSNDSKGGAGMITWGITLGCVIQLADF
jgi:outer membrane protease